MAGFAARILCLAALALGAATPQASAEPALKGAGARGPVTNLPLPRFVSMRAETANARRGPSLNHRVDWTFVRPGMPLEVTAEYGNWRRVRDADGAGGWVHHTLLSGVRTVLVRAEAPTAMHAGANTGAAIRAFVEPGAVARLEVCEGAWCRVSADGIEGWAPRELFWGVGAGETLD